ncbi:MAG: ATP-binding cassette domain-containing protein [Propionibacteriaceae bacterium]|nr:ATP-binding cassette domain-containing protein [Propionibacteriaceae bacterium]
MPEKRKGRKSPSEPQLPLRWDDAQEQASVSPQSQAEVLAALEMPSRFTPFPPFAEVDLSEDFDGDIPDEVTSNDSYESDFQLLDPTAWISRFRKTAKPLPVATPAPKIAGQRLKLSDLTDFESELGDYDRLAIDVDINAPARDGLHLDPKVWIAQFKQGVKSAPEGELTSPKAQRRRRRHATTTAFEPEIEGFRPERAFRRTEQARDGLRIDAKKWIAEFRQASAISEEVVFVDEEPLEVDEVALVVDSPTFSVDEAALAIEVTAAPTFAIDAVAPTTDQVEPLAAAGVSEVELPQLTFAEIEPVVDEAVFVTDVQMPATVEIVPSADGVELAVGEAAFEVELPQLTFAEFEPTDRGAELASDAVAAELVAAEYELEVEAELTQLSGSEDIEFEELVAGDLKLEVSQADAFVTLESDEGISEFGFHDETIEPVVEIIEPARDGFQIDPKRWITQFRAAERNARTGLSAVTEVPVAPELSTVVPAVVVPELEVTVSEVNDAAQALSAYELEQTVATTVPEIDVDLAPAVEFESVGDAEYVAELATDLEYAVELEEPAAVFVVEPEIEFAVAPEVNVEVEQTTAPEMVVEVAQIDEAELSIESEHVIEYEQVAAPEIDFADWELEVEKAETVAVESDWDEETVLAPVSQLETSDLVETHLVPTFVVAQKRSELEGTALAANQAISIRGLRKDFGSFTAVDGIDLDVAEGQVFGFLGPNGSGKTTTIRMLTGTLRPTAGAATVLGYDIVNQPDSIRSQVGYMSQKFSLFEDLTVAENLRFYGGIYELDDAEFQAQQEYILAMAGLEGRENELTRNLSVGWRQRLALGTAAIHSPDLIFLDEPTSGVDPVARRQFWSLLYELAAEGVTIFVTTHYMEEASHCNQLAFINAGQIVAYGSPDEIRERHANQSLNEIFIDLIKQDS